MWNPWKLRRVFVSCTLIETLFSACASVAFSLGQPNFIPNMMAFCIGSSRQNVKRPFVPHIGPRDLSLYCYCYLTSLHTRHVLKAVCRKLETTALENHPASLRYIGFGISSSVIILCTRRSAVSEFEVGNTGENAADSI